MRSTKRAKQTIKQWLHVSASPETRDRIWREILSIQEQSGKTNSALVRPDRWKTILRTKTARFAVAAVFLMVVLFGINFWPDSGSQNSKWWLGPPAAWGQQIMVKLEKIEALIYRDQTVFVGRYGSTHVSGTWSRHYEAKDRSREDRYYEDTDEDTYGQSNPDSTLQQVTYKVSDGNDLIQCDVSYEHQCYTNRINEGGAYERDPVERLRFYISLLDNADRILDTTTFEGRECIGFEISADKYGDNPKDRIDRIWFDVETKLPVRIEMYGVPVTDQPGETFTFIQDQFEYYVRIPAEMFEPDIPDGFINAEPDEVRAAKMEQEKGPMLYADVPVGLKDKIVTALKGVKTAVYRERSGSIKDGDGLSIPGKRIFISESGWRIDSYSGERVQKTEWYVTYKDDWSKTSFDFNDRHFRLIRTTLHFPDHSYSETTYGNTSHPDNPMDWIIFLAGHIDKADRFFESRQIEGVECFGFELSAKKYGTNPDTSVHTLWFDSKTMLPVMLEHEWLEDDRPRKMIQDQFEWDAELPVDTFVPKIPEGFVLKHPGDIRATQEK